MNNLVYSCVFFNTQYIKLLDMLLMSYRAMGRSGSNTEYLVMCDPGIAQDVIRLLHKYRIEGRIWILENIETKFQATCARYRIFDYEKIHEYDKILYLDCDTLVHGPIDTILNIPLDDKIYAIKDGSTSHRYFGGDLFVGNNPNTSAFSTSILMFNSSPLIKSLFSDILYHISKVSRVPEYFDQPFVIYHAVRKEMYDNTTLVPRMVRLWTGSRTHHPPILSHFAGGGVGNWENKLRRMQSHVIVQEEHSQETNYE